MKQGLAHLPLLPLMRGQEGIFHTDAAENRPGGDRFAQTTNLLLLFKHSALWQLE